MNEHEEEVIRLLKQAIEEVRGQRYEEADSVRNQAALLIYPDDGDSRTNENISEEVRLYFWKVNRNISLRIGEIPKLYD